MQRRLSDCPRPDGCGYRITKNHFRLTDSARATRSRCMDRQRLSTRISHCYAADGTSFGHVWTATHLHHLPGHFRYWIALLWAGTHPGEPDRYQLPTAYRHERVRPW